MSEKCFSLAAVGVKFPAYEEKSLMLHGFCKYGSALLIKQAEKEE